MEIKDGGILIIAAPRVGGTNLMKSLGSYYNKKTRMEYDIVNKYPKYNPKKDVLKYVPIWEGTIDSIMNDKIYQNILESAKEFETIILIDRKNKIEQTESYYVLRTYNRGLVDKKWSTEHLINKDEKYEFFEYYINSFSDFFKRISSDLNIPIDYYEENYKALFEENKLYNMFLIAPQTSDKRIRKIDSISNGFIYMVSSSSITGSKDSFSSEQINYFKRIEKMNLDTPRIIGFGVGNKETFDAAVGYSKGAIIGSAFIKNLHESGVSSIDSFIKSIR